MTSQMSLDGIRCLNTPLLRYFGAKWSQSKQIGSHFPANIKYYAEPYAGSFACGFSMYLPDAKLYLNDKHAELINFYECLKHYPDDLINNLKDHKFSDETWKLAKALSKVNGNIARATGFYLRSWMSFGGEGRRWINSRTTKMDRRSPDISSLWIASEILQSVKISSIEALDFIRQHDSPEMLFYVDPPYHWTARAPKDKRHKDQRNAMPRAQYLHEHTNLDHIKLALLLHSCKATVVLSGKACDAYNAMYGHWQSAKIHGVDQSGLHTVEMIWISPQGSRKITPGAAKWMYSSILENEVFAPDNVRIKRETGRGRVDWVSPEPIFNAKRKRYIGRIDSAEHQAAASAVENRKLLKKLKKIMEEG